MNQSVPRDQKVRLILAFAAVYLIWGSTYLAIRYAVQTMPPFLMAGMRFGIAGLILTLWSRSRGAAWPTRSEWRVALITGCLLLLVGNGAVVWAEQKVTSSLTALIVSAVPLVTASLDWARPGGQRPRITTMIGLVTGFVGVALLINPGASDTARVDPAGAAALLAATVCWSMGTIYTRTAKQAPAPLMAAGANMLMGSVVMLLAAVVFGEPGRLDLARVSTHSWIALLYLTTIGAVIGFTAFFYLARNTTPAKSTTYAYVNPVVAIFLGWAIAGEPITLRVIVAAIIIIAGVVMITTGPYLRDWLLQKKIGAGSDASA